MFILVFFCWFLEDQTLLANSALGMCVEKRLTSCGNIQTIKNHSQHTRNSETAEHNLVECIRVRGFNVRDGVPVWFRFCIFLIYALPAVTFGIFFSCLLMLFLCLITLRFFPLLLFSFQQMFQYPFSNIQIRTSNYMYMVFSLSKLFHRHSIVFFVSSPPFR